MPDLITITKLSSSILNPKTFAMTKSIEAVLNMEAIQDVYSQNGESAVIEIIGRQIVEQINKAKEK